MFSSHYYWPSYQIMKELQRQCTGTERVSACVLFLKQALLKLVPEKGT